MSDDETKIQILRQLLLSLGYMLGMQHLDLMKTHIIKMCHVEGLAGAFLGFIPT